MESEPSSLSAERTITIHVSHRGRTHPITLLTTATLSALQEAMEGATDVPAAYQKVIYKGKSIINAASQSKLAVPKGQGSSSGEASNAKMTIDEANLKDGAKAQLFGPTMEEMGEMRKVEDEKKRRDTIMEKRALKGATKVSKSIPSSSSTNSLQYTFHTLRALPHLPNPTQAHTLLTRLSSDPAIAHIMSLHHFSIGLLTELAPHEHPHLLGLNENRGEVIRLRLRTDRYDGFRVYGDVRRVLVHELTHCVWGEHDDNFKTLNSLLNREVASYESTLKASTRTLGESRYDGPRFDRSTSTVSPSSGGSFSPEAEAEAYARSHRLGGGDAPSGVDREGGRDTLEGRRERILAATLRRLEEQEREIEEMCGSGGGVGASSSSAEDAGDASPQPTRDGTG